MKQKTILVADDDKAIRNLLKFKLKKAGFKVILAGNGKEAIERLTNDISVALIDLNMPEIDGKGCLEYIKTNSINTQVIVITASDKIVDAVATMRLGAYDYLTKPFIVNNAITLVHKAVNSYEREIQLRKAKQELDEKIRELETFNRIAVGRELKMLELKNEINELYERMGKKPKYDMSVFEE